MWKIFWNLAIVTCWYSQFLRMNTFAIRGEKIASLIVIKRRYSSRKKVIANGFVNRKSSAISTKAFFLLFVKEVEKFMEISLSYLLWMNLLMTTMKKKRKTFFHPHSSFDSSKIKWKKKYIWKLQILFILWCHHEKEKKRKRKKWWRWSEAISI